MSGVVFRRLDRDAVLVRLRAWAAEDLARRPEVREAILVGSLARGDWSARSDADVVVVVDRAEGPAAFRGAAYAPTRSVGIPVDVLVYTEQERGAWPPRWREAVAHGIPLITRA